jgi:hypothetical protein
VISALIMLTGVDGLPLHGRMKSEKVIPGLKKK